MNKTFLASGLVMVVSAALGYWLLADTASKTWRRNFRTAVVVPAAPAAAEQSAQAAAGLIPARAIDEFMTLAGVFEPTGEELEVQDLLASFPEPEFLPLPRVVVDPLLGAGEEAATLPSGLALLQRTAFQLFAWKFSELFSQIQPLIGTKAPSLKANSDEPAFDGVPYPLGNETMEARPADLNK